MPSPLLKRIPVDEMPEDIKAAHQQSMAIRGDASFFEVFANHPDLYRWYTESFYGQVFRAGLVELRIKELARLRLSLEHGCRFCNQGNRLDAQAAGISTSEIKALETNQLSGFSERERAVIALADTLSLSQRDASLSTELHARLTGHFNDAQILELGLVMGVLSGMAKFLFAFDLVEQEASCAFHANETNAQP